MKEIKDVQSFSLSHFLLQTQFNCFIFLLLFSTLPFYNSESTLWNIPETFSLYQFLCFSSHVNLFVFVFLIILEQTEAADSLSPLLLSVHTTDTDQRSVSTSSGFWRHVWSSSDSFHHRFCLCFLSESLSLCCKHKTAVYFYISHFIRRQRRVLDAFHDLAFRKI